MRAIDGPLVAGESGFDVRLGSLEWQLLGVPVTAAATCLARDYTNYIARWRSDRPPPGFRVFFPGDSRVFLRGDFRVFLLVENDWIDLRAADVLVTRRHGPLVAIICQIDKSLHDRRDDGIENESAV